MLSQKLKTYFHLVVKAKEKTDKTKYLPPERINRFGMVFNTVRTLERYNWNVDIAVLKSKIGALNTPDIYPDNRLLTFKEEMLLQSIMDEASQQNIKRPEDEKEAIERMIDLLERTKDISKGSAHSLIFFKEAHEQWADRYLGI